MRWIAAGLAILALPAGAAAKQATQVTLCGADGCNDSMDHRTIAPLMALGRMVRETPADQTQGYRLRVLFGHSTEDGFLEAWVRPAPGRVYAADGAWVALPPAATTQVRGLAAGLRPLDGEPLPVDALVALAALRTALGLLNAA